MTFVNSISFGSYNRYKLEGLINILKEKNHYYKCRVCGKVFVEKEDDLCERCKHFADLKYKEKKVK